jgi:hypothetical protein
LHHLGSGINVLNLVDRRTMLKIMLKNKLDRISYICILFVLYF